MAHNLPLVSVIVHTKNSERTIKRHLESIQTQSYKNIEIIAVDNFSSDKTPQILKHYTKKFYSLGPERSAQRNFGVKKSKGKYVYIVDSDMYLSKNTIYDCVDLMEKNKKIKAIVIPEKSIGKGYWTKCKALERKCYEGDETIEAARFFDKKVFLEFKGYDEKITGPEDWDLPQRIKKKFQIGRIRQYVLHDEGRLTLINVAKKKFYYAQKVSVYLSKHSKNTTIFQSIYFLRPAFYRNWKLLIQNIPVTLGMIVMLGFEQVAGILGIAYSKIKK